MRTLSQTEIKLLIEEIAKPTYKFLIRRILNVLMEKYDMEEIDFNSFFTVVTASMAAQDANMIQWMADFYHESTGASVDKEKLRVGFLGYFYNQSGIKVQ